MVRRTEGRGGILSEGLRKTGVEVQSVGCGEQFEEGWADQYMIEHLAIAVEDKGEGFGRLLQLDQIGQRHLLSASLEDGKGVVGAFSGLAERYHVNPKTVAKWKKRSCVQDAPMGPKQPASTALNREEEALIVAFRQHTLLPLDDCLYALQATLPHLARSALHRCL
jgi:hypothetical protein